MDEVASQEGIPPRSQWFHTGVSAEVPHPRCAYILVYSARSVVSARVELWSSPSFTRRRNEIDKDQKG